MNIAHLIETMPTLGSLLTDAATIAPQRALDELIRKVQELQAEQDALRNTRAASGAERDRNNKRLTELDELIAEGEKKVAEAMAGMERAVTKGLFDLGSAFGSIGAAVAQYGLRPLTGRLADVTAEIKEVDRQIAIAAVMPGGGAHELMALEERRARLVQEQADAQAEQVTLQKQLLALQEQQQKLGFLEQQQKLLDLIEKYGLNPADILGDVSLGLDASIGGITEAMTRALAAIVDQLNTRIGTVPVAGPVPPATTNDYASMPNMWAMPNMTAQSSQTHSAVDNSITFEKGAIVVEVGPGQDGRQLAEQLMPEIDRIIRERRGR
jgi:hypothetical protein